MQEHGLRENEGSLCDSETKNSAHCRHYCHCYPRCPRLSAAAGKGGGGVSLILSWYKVVATEEHPKCKSKWLKYLFGMWRRILVRVKLHQQLLLGLDCLTHRIKSIKKWLWNSGCFNVSVFKSCRSILSAGKASWSESSPKTRLTGTWIDVLLLYAL